MSPPPTSVTQNPSGIFWAVAISSVISCQLFRYTELLSHSTSVQSLLIDENSIHQTAHTCNAAPKIWCNNSDSGAINIKQYSTAFCWFGHILCHPITLYSPSASITLPERNLHSNSIPSLYPNGLQVRLPFPWLNTLEFPSSATLLLSPCLYHQTPVLRQSPCQYLHPSSFHYAYVVYLQISLAG